VTLRIGLIGCGAIARRIHIPAFKQCDDVDVVAFASRTRASADAAAAEWGSGDATDDWRAVVERDDVDGVCICTPNALHREQAVVAAKAGKHVLVEKPMATTLEEADEMIAVAEGAGVVLHVAHNLRYVPAVIATRDALSRVGSIVAVRHAFGHSGPRDWAPDSTWFFDPEQSGGGALIDLGIHSMDLIRFVTGLEATEVTCTLTGDASVEDAAFTTIRLEGGGAAIVHTSWVISPREFEMVVHGTNGTLSLGFGGLTFRSTAGEKDSIDVPSLTASPCSDFVRAVRGEQPEGPVASGEEGRAALAIVSAAYESARTGKRVEVSP
jgi:predicted dehydrogenase